ncbi:class I SAM-dependent methyltransferase [uncultured Winogradskyella sp.]|uniref:THUMP-like domain-containing protein n=1 Tax=uncultured Winogradskyella sp. TaxID=395353 RepID=UPI0030D6DED5
MNSLLLNTEIQAYIDTNLNADISDLLLKGINFSTVNTKDIIEQIEAKNRSQKKLPTWFNTKSIYYPNKLNIEQTSSEISAKYKANLVSGTSLIDLTGGFGVDTYYFSKQIEKATHCEINAKLSEITNHNYNTLKVSNVTCINEDGIASLKRLDQHYDWIYLDPSRRDDIKQKVFLLSDCAPNAKTFQGLFLKYAKNVMIKTSPLLDITATLLDLKYVKDIHIIAVNNEVKELLWVLERDYSGNVNIKTVNIQTVNIQKKAAQHFNFQYKNESSALAEFSEPLTYLYEPNAAILKSGAFNSVSADLKVSKLHKHSHLYTSVELIEFPGRRFKIEKQLPFNKKTFAKEKITKANVTTRNFPLSVGDIRKKLKIKDGGSLYLFFTTNLNNVKVILVCSKV